MTSIPPAPSHVPHDAYSGPAPATAGLLRLDGNVAGYSESALRDYPDASSLEGDIAARLGLGAERFVVTAGADDALDRICRAYLGAGREMVLPVPTFEMLYRFAQLAGGTIVTVSWTEGFPTDDIVAAVGPNTGIVAIVSPNNPTGAVASAADLRRVARAAPHAIVLLDHAYVEYADDDLTPVAAQLANVVTVRTFSKAWGLAGCRVGYLMAAPSVALVLRNAGNPFPVATPSIDAVREQQLDAAGQMVAHVTHVREERQRLADHLARRGVPTRPSQANFLLVDMGQRVRFVYEALAFSGVRVRFFPHRPEISTSLRISLPGAEAQFGALLQALDLCLAPEAILFDMDGVLADVGESYRRCIIDTAETFGVTLTHATVEAAINAGDANNDWILTQRLLRAHGVDQPLDEITARYQARYLGSTTQPGLQEHETLLVDPGLLAQLATRYRLAIVTGRPRAEAEGFLSREGITDCFDTMVCLEDAPSKPDPAPIKLAMHRLGVARAWMLGDTPDDMVAAAGAAVLPIGIFGRALDPEPTRAALQQAGAVAVLDSVASITELLP